MKRVPCPACAHRVRQRGSITCAVCGGYTVSARVDPDIAAAYRLRGLRGLVDLVDGDPHEHSALARRLYRHWFYTGNTEGDRPKAMAMLSRALQRPYSPDRASAPWRQ